MPEILKINALVATLDRHNRFALGELREKYPEARRVLQPGIQLGEVYSRTAILVDLAKRATSTIRVRIDPTVGRIRRKLHLARQLRLTVSIVATISSAGLASAIYANWSSIGIFVTAGINTVASLTALFSNYLDGPVMGSKRAGVEILTTLVQLSVSVLKLEQDLILIDVDSKNEQKARALVRRANELAVEFHEIEILLGSQGD
jgi:hypothetical protein